MWKSILRRSLFIFILTAIILDPLINYLIGEENFSFQCFLTATLVFIPISLVLGFMSFKFSKYLKSISVND
jgi:hypothetical protein